MPFSLSTCLDSGDETSFIPEENAGVFYTQRKCGGASFRLLHKPRTADNVRSRFSKRFPRRPLLLFRVALANAMLFYTTLNDQDCDKPPVSNQSEDMYLSIVWYGQLNWFQISEHCPRVLLQDFRNTRYAKRNGLSDSGGRMMAALTWKVSREEVVAPDAHSIDPLEGWDYTLTN